MQSTHHRKIISHFVGLSGIGGVQSNFIEYMNNIELHPSKYHHKVYTIGSVDSYYQLTNDVFDIRDTAGQHQSSDGRPRTATEVGPRRGRRSR